MLLQMAMILALIGTMTEVLLVHKVRYVDKLYTKGSNLFWISRWHVDGMVWNTVGSFALSAAQGKMFGATGLVIAMSGAISTGISQAYFSIETYVQKTYGHNTILEFLKAQAPEIKSQVANLWQLAKDVWRVVYFVLKVITFPIWGTRKAIAWWNSVSLNPFSTTEGA